MQVCPANWKPGEATMIADPEKSLEYFQSAAAGDEDDAEFGTTLKPIATPADYEAAISSPGPVVVRTPLWIPQFACMHKAPNVAIWASDVAR